MFRLVVGRAEDGYPELQEQLIRQFLREFPYRNSTLLLNMVRQLHNTKIVSTLNIFRLTSLKQIVIASQAQDFHNPQLVRVLVKGHQNSNH